eukprot:45426-Prymnesium_polylepis.1
MRKWEGFGWCAGVTTSVNSDGRRTIDTEARVNFFARYDMDPEEEEPIPHVTRARARSIRDDRPRTP